MGKLPFGILQRARPHPLTPSPKGEGEAFGVPVMLIAGRIADEQQLLDAGFARVACINPPGIPIEDAMRPETAKENIKTTMIQTL